MTRPRHMIATVLFLVLTAALVARLGYLFFGAGDKTAILPGRTTDGHYQIELACDACHTDEKQENLFTASGVPNSACNACHGDDLADFSDSHPVRKFRNPENAVFLEHIDALSCVECHREHNQRITGDMGLTLPADYCAHCHEVTLEHLDSHRDLGYDTCATAGCHNFHDNMALAPSFLRKHFGEADILAQPAMPETDALAAWLGAGHEARETLAGNDQDAPASEAGDLTILTDWHGTAHAAAGINCSDCHGTDPWVERPGHETCASCHDFQVETFLKGRHGMRLAHDGLSPMRPELARQPMKAEASHRSLDCSACHQPHRYDRDFAAQQACLQCHDDDHSRNYGSSRHAKLWQAEVDGTAAPDTGVSCATCHMPAVAHGEGHAISHDQSANLRPNEKMLRSVCLNCHGLQFSMDALADEELIDGNFHRRPSDTHPGISWAVDSAVERGDENMIRLKEWLEAEPGRTRDGFSPSDN